MSLFGVIVGFTGTRDGMSQKQKQDFALMIQRINPVEFHHGDCVGAGEQAHDIVKVFAPECSIVVHPPLNPKDRAWCKGSFIRPAEDYIKRNHNIVNNVEMMIATPKNGEELRSGTWATIRFAKKVGRTVKILFPQ